MTPAKAYDKAYFDRWYRDPRRRVATAADVARKARLVVGIAESLLQRPVRSALDIGSSETGRPVARASAAARSAVSRRTASRRRR